MGKNVCKFDKRNNYHCKGVSVQFDKRHLYRHGNYVKKYSNGKVEEQGKFRFDRRDGEWKKFYRNGKLKEVSFYFYGIHYKNVTQYNKFGKVARRFNYPDRASVKKHLVEDKKLESKLTQLLTKDLLQKKKKLGQVETLVMIRYRQYVEVAYLLKIDSKFQFENIKFTLKNGTWRL